VILHNGDCLEFMRSLPDNSIDMCLTDPPYKTTKRGSSGGTGGMLKTEDFKAGKGGFVHNDVKFSQWLPEVYRVLKDGSHFYVMCNNKSLFELLSALNDSSFKVCKTLIWAKNNCITNMYYMDSHEYIIFCYKGKAVKINNCGTRSVLNFDNVKGKLHPSEKPVDMLTALINNSSMVGDIIIDPFMGSGSTGVACVNTNRKFIGCELDKGYFDIAVGRINGNR
jgi:site-specific DNA-methyltransferase (adenine-specific)